MSASSDLERDKSDAANPAVVQDWWTVPQAAVWIRTRDLERVRGLEPHQKVSLEAADKAASGSRAAAILCLLLAFKHGAVVPHGWPAGAKFGPVGSPIRHPEWTNAILGDKGDADTDSGKVEGLSVRAAEVIDYWPAPATILADGPVRLKLARARLNQEDPIDWLLRHPAVIVTGRNAAGERRTIDTAECDVTDPDERLHWSAVMLSLAAANKTDSQSSALGQSGDLSDAGTADGVATVRAVINAIRADKKQLKRIAFTSMVRELVKPRPTLPEIEALWRELAAEEWRKPGQGSPPAGVMVEDWESFRPAP